MDECETMGVMSDHTPNRPIKATKTTFEIVDVVADRGTVGVLELAEELDRSKSTIHSHLSTLESLGYLINDEGRYRLSLKWFDHGIRARNERTVFDVATKEIRALAETIDEPVWLYTEDHGRAVVVDAANLDGGDDYKVARVGWRTYLHCTSSGKTILAHLPDETVDEIIARHGLPAETDNTITSRAELERELVTIREQGYATNDEETADGIYALSVPIVLDERVFGAVCISGPAYRLSKPDVQASLLDSLFETVNRIELTYKY
ncbi:IclR family transcriptional regulator [Salinadaptatus halalkaliphilus]|uniref:IclR family transcriptional regulator n=1 Tax=Salinadaptatus halalkaliphilus TaxID=2419781 RepID=A0A4S3TT66_9EURY|nr:IclR family transcriptional regulator [Salinadaptatus halalkaliphilus]THE66665.1 IclR family transcriptional regulator [Salinadaptatus halalkaliphilus]